MRRAAVIASFNSIQERVRVMEKETKRDGERETTASLTDLLAVAERGELRVDLHLVVHHQLVA